MLRGVWVGSLEALRKTVNFSNWAEAVNSVFDEGERKQEGKSPPFIVNLRPARITQLKALLEE